MFARATPFSMLRRLPRTAIAILPMLLAGLVSAQSVIAADGEKKSEPATMKVIQRLAHKNYVQGLAWNSDGSKLATLSDFGALVTIWNTRTWEKEREIRQYSAAYSGPGIGWTYDGKVLTSAGAKTQPEGIYSMNLWDPATGALVKRIEGPPIPPGAYRHNQANRIAVSKSGSLAAIIFSHIRNTVPIFGAPDWSINRIVELEGAPPFTVGYATAVAFAPDERAIVIANAGNLQIIDLQDGHTRLAIPAYKRVENVVGPIVNALTFSPDGKYLASGPTFFKPEPDHGPVRIWDTASGNLVLALPGSEQMTRTLSWSADGARLAVVSDQKLRVWNVEDLRKIEIQFEFDKVEGLAVAFAPSGLVAVTNDFSVLVFK
jgi:WD40 repeat protein